jgi:hypothetical protein
LFARAPHRVAILSRHGVDAITRVVRARPLRGSGEQRDESPKPTGTAILPHIREDLIALVGHKEVQDDGCFIQ